MCQAQPQFCQKPVNMNVVFNSSTTLIVGKVYVMPKREGRQNPSCDCRVEVYIPWAYTLTNDP